MFHLKDIRLAMDFHNFKVISINKTFNFNSHYKSDYLFTEHIIITITLPIYN